MAVEFAIFCIDLYIKLLHVLNCICGMVLVYFFNWMPGSLEEGSDFFNRKWLKMTRLLRTSFNFFFLACKVKLRFLFDLFILILIARGLPLNLEAAQCTIYAHKFKPILTKSWFFFIKKPSPKFYPISRRNPKIGHMQHWWLICTVDVFASKGTHVTIFLHPWTKYSITLN